MNSVQLIGRLTGDPSGPDPAGERGPVRLWLAVRRRQRRGTDFVTVKAWGRTGENALTDPARGCRVAVYGHLEQTEWVDDEGRRQERVSVVAHGVELLNAPTGEGVHGGRQDHDAA